MMGQHIARLLDEGVNKTAETTVTVAANAPLLSEGRNLRGRVKVAVRVIWTASHQADGVRIDLSFHSVEVTAEVLCNWHLS